jgi:hypothetical protein
MLLLRPGGMENIFSFEAQVGNSVSARMAMWIPTIVLRRVMELRLILSFFAGDGSASREITVHTSILHFLRTLPQARAQFSAMFTST